MADDNSWRLSMVIYAFTAINKRKVIRMSLDFWYRNLKDTYNLDDFFKNCCLCKYCNEYVVFYRGKIPMRKEI
jgi:hypothetical protein